MMLAAKQSRPGAQPEAGNQQRSRVLGKPNEDETLAMSAGVQGRVLQLVELPGWTPNPMTSVLLRAEKGR